MGIKVNKKLIGKWGENQASLFLIRRGYKIVTRNYSFREGELDIIARDIENTLCFIEVKTRSYGEGSAERATSLAKIEKIKKTAMNFCLCNNIDIENTPISFEQVSVYVNKKDRLINFKKYTIPI